MARSIPTWYFRKPGGGPLYDMTAYALHGLTSVLGPAQRVTALSGMVLPQREFGGRSITAEMDDNTVALLDFGDGAFAVAHGTAGGHRDRGLRGGVLLRHRRRDPRRPARTASRSTSPGAS